jgi:hypothetical protein
VLIPALAGGFLTLILAAWTTSALVLGVGKFWSGSTEAGDLLGRIALVASSSTDIPPMDQIRDDQFAFIETYGNYYGVLLAKSGASFIPDAPHSRQIWLSVDGSQPGLLRDPNVSSTDRVLGDPYTGPLSATLENLTTLPTNPDVLLAKIYKETWGAGPNPQQEAFTTIGDLIRESVVPPELAGALYRAAARIPGIEIIDDSVDALGRHGVAIARTDAGIRYEWIFEQNTLQFLGERQVLVDQTFGLGGTPQVAGLPPVGAVVASTAIVARAIVDHAGQLPG